jgi:hypothetical protein
MERQNELVVLHSLVKFGLWVNIDVSPLGTIFSAWRASQPETKWRVTTGKRPGIACAGQSALNRDSLFGYFLGAKK